MTKRLAAPTLLAAPMLITAAALAGCAAEADTNAEISAPAATVVGEAENCISTSSIDTTHVRDDRTIDFEMRNGTVYRNTLPANCSGLGFDRRFGYETTIGRLCDSDTITVLRSGGIDGPTCGLGEFVPIRYADGAG